MQDTTSSAMTEVALGLSMAFFTLLIVALISMSVPKANLIKSADKSASTIPEDFKKMEAIDINIASKQSGQKSSENLIQFAFYFKNSFYDKTLTLRTIKSFAKKDTLVIAVDPTLTFAEVFALRQKINHPKLSITTSNKAWRLRLQQMEVQD